MNFFNNFKVHHLFLSIFIPLCVVQHISINNKNGRKRKRTKKFQPNACAWKGLNTHKKSSKKPCKPSSSYLLY